MVMAKNVHVVFGIYSKDSLERSFSVANHLAGEIFNLGDDLRIGPLETLDNHEGVLARKKWFANIDDVCLNRNFESEGVNDHATIKAIKQVLSTGQVIHIWFGHSSFDLLALGRLMKAIQHFATQLIIVPVSDSIQSSLWGGEFVPKILGVVSAEQIPALEKHFRSPTERDQETYIAIWVTARRRAESVRLVDVTGLFQENLVDKINQVLLSFCKKEFQKSATVIGHSLSALEFEVSDSILNWMLKSLVSTGQLEARGTLKMMRDYEVRLL
jgi:hypothetical protein